MFFFMRSPGDERYVDSGSVSCPRRGRDVEIDLCAGCQWMTTIDLQAKPPFVRCRPAPALGASPG
ncbi:MAG TPA: hypothetical protein VM756_09180 [Burkholderiales bacterium]|jgi:hypothetical protein|nr:hypothetical protein [Burkholderiales bacterium]